MKNASVLLPVAVLFWGWQTGIWPVAVPVAAALGAAPLVSVRWTVRLEQFYRIADFCTVLTLLLLGYLYFTYGNPRAIVLLFQWLPLVLLPLVLAHLYGTAERIDLRVLFWSLRRNPPQPPVDFDPTYPYFAIWLLAASAANVRGEAFYFGLAVLVMLALVRFRPLSYPVGAWAIAFSCAVALGYGIQSGARNGQLWLESNIPDWLAGGGSVTDPYRTVTDMGTLGELKLSDTIVLRVRSTDGARPPRLLHRASYNLHGGVAWIAGSAPFATVSPSANRIWVLAPGAVTPRRIVIRDHSPQANPVLSLPAGTLAVEDLDADLMTRNALGAVQIERAPGYFSYVAAYADHAVHESPPSAQDTRIGRAERRAFGDIATELGLASLPPAAAVERVHRYFAEQFRYAAFQKDQPRHASPVVDFVRRTRAGHCEYFASATALLLRAAGIPARYATGFAVLEYSDFEDAYLVRERHAHAWAIAWVDGAWRVVDTTPPQWFSIEAGDKTFGSRVRDIASWLRLQAAGAGMGGGPLLPVALVVMFPFALWLAWRLYRSHRRLPQKPGRNARGASFPGADSEFYQIERRAAELGWARHPHETALDWIARLRADAPLDTQALGEIAALHYRYRFDPAGIDGGARRKLAEAVTAWLARNPIRQPRRA